MNVKKSSRNLDILLVAPPYEDIYGPVNLKVLGCFNPPLGLSYLQSYIKKLGFKSKIVDMTCLTNSWENINKIIINLKPGFVGISCTTPGIPEAQKIANFVKAIDSRIKIILGGWHPSAMVEETILYPWVDYVVFGEGEETLSELLQGRPLMDIDGLAYKDNYGAIFINRKRELIGELNELPFPDFDDLTMDRYYSPWLGRITNILMGRGCGYNCSFCASNIIWGKKIRIRSPDNVISEIELHMNKYGITNFSFNDDTFTAQRDEVIDFCHKVIERELNIRWDCLTRIDCIDEILLKNMKRAGCKVIRFGIEYGNQKQLDRINKNLDKSKIQYFLNLTNKVGIESYGFFIIGQPNGTKKDIFDTIDFAKSLPLDYAHFTMITALPGTQVWRDCKNNNGISLITNDWSRFCFHKLPAVELPNIKPEKLLSYYHLAYRKFYLRWDYIIKRFFSSCFSGQIMRDIRAFIAVLILEFKRNLLR